MNILFLTQIIPYPPDAGPRVKTWHVLRYLAHKGHRVILASFVRPEEEQYVEALREVCQAVYTVPIRRSRAADVRYWLRSHLTGRPFLIERDDLEGMRRLVQQILASEPIDAIHADQLTMTQFALPQDASSEKAVRDWPYLIFDAHNAVWTIVERMRANAPFYLKPLAALEAQRVKRYEGQIVQKFDTTLAVAEPDRKLLLEAAAQAPVGNGAASRSPRLEVIPIAVDTRELQPAQRAAGSCALVTVGTLHYPPNADGIRWFIQEVFPLVRKQVPEATLTVIGKNPPQDFLQAAAHNPQAIQVTGYVPDLGPYMNQAALMVVAVRAGGGMRVRILEAFARGMPVVTTTVGLEGIEAEPGREVMVADAPAEFAQAVVRLLGDRALQASLAEQGRRLAERRYDWQSVLKKLGEVYQEVEVERTTGIKGLQD